MKFFPMQADGLCLMAPPVPERPKIGGFERLPKWLNCIPLILQWLWLALRYRSLTLPSAANPHITSGGMVGEGKCEYFDGMGKTARSFIAPYVTVTVARRPGLLEEALAKMDAAGLAFPVIAKPDLGWCGYGVRALRTACELKAYLLAFPIGETLLLQRYLSDPGEAGLYYVRRPGEAEGRVIGITLRYFPQATGDGKRTLRQLVQADARLSRGLANRLHRPSFDAEAIPPAGEKIRLSTIGSTRVGGEYRDGSRHITARLSRAVDAIARDMPEFHVGRFDVRFRALADLRRGEGFSIMEVNGAGSESVHAWDPKYSIAQSYRIIFKKQRMLFEMGEANRRNGYPVLGILGLARLYFRQQRLIGSYPLSN